MALRSARRLGAPGRASVGEVLVAARGVGVELGGQPILDSVDLSVAAGEVVALVGPNGAGKSTLLGALTGDVALAAGAVLVCGRALGEWSGVELALRRSVLPQQVTVTFPFSVRDVVEMGRAPWVHVDGDARGGEVVERVMVECDVASMAERQLPTLSGGERARVALARVLAQEAPILFLDEPTAALDLHHQELVLGLARARASAGVAVVVVLHDLALAGAHADRIVVLSHGRVVADGPPAEVLDEDLLSAVYQHPIEVVPHPRTAAPLVMPRR
ncbi:MAG TPA: heme ABC transporter ATP-binding protein [Iamia sp.]|nr:heme ABC transporter ATP-binding protein [Iamia sp.]